MRGHLLTGLALGLIGAFASWLFVTFAPAGGWNTDAENIWRLFHIPAWMVAVIIDGNPHGGGAGPVLFGIFLQWFAVGWIVSWIRTYLRDTDPTRRAE